MEVSVVVSTSRLVSAGNCVVSVCVARAMDVVLVNSYVLTIVLAGMMDSSVVVKMIVLVCGGSCVVSTIVPGGNEVVRVISSVLTSVDAGSWIVSVPAGREVV